LLGFLYSVGTYLIRYGRYQLVKTGNLFTKAHGILRYRSASLTRERVQALKLEEGLLRRWFGLADLWIDSGGDRARVDDKKKREPFVPVARAPEAYSLVGEVLPDLANAQPEWKRVSPKAIMRGTRKLWLLILFLLLGNVAPLGWFSLVFLPAFPLAYFLNLKWYQNRGYWFDDRYLVSRKGWFNRETLYLPIQVVQNVSITQNPFDRRLGLATIAVDTAGQSNTGGGAVISNLPLDSARQLQSHLTLRARSKPAGRRLNSIPRAH
jgi:putative membrane protein